MSVPGLRRSAATVGFFTGISRVLGLAREVMMAGYFGTSLVASAFVVAFRIPNLFRQLFGEGALSAAFVPIFTDVMEKEGKAAANRLAGKVMTMLCAAMLLIVGVGIALITVWMGADGLGPRAGAVLPLLRIMLPYALLICFVAVCMGVLNSLNHFAVPASTPIILNVVWILCLLFLCPRFGESHSEQIYGVAWGIILAGVIQVLYQIPALRRMDMYPRLSFAWRDRSVIRILGLMGPATLGLGIHQINVCIDGVLAFWAAPWAPAALSYSERLIYLPLGLFATALGTVLLPTYSRHAAREQTAEILETMRHAARDLMLVVVPAAVGLWVLAGPIVQMMFENGMFDGASTTYTARAVRFYAPGLLVFSLYKIIVPVFYSLKDTRTPVRVGIMCVAVNFVLNVLFVITWPTDYKHAGLATATVLASAVNCVVLAVILKRRIGSPGWLGLGRDALRVCIAAAGMGAVAFWVHRLVVGTPCCPPTKMVQVAGVLLAIGAAVVVYTGLLWLVWREQMLSFVRALKRRRSTGQ